MIKLLAYTEQEAYYQTESGSCIYINPGKNINEPARGSDVARAIKRGFTKSDEEFSTLEDFQNALVRTFGV